MSVRACIRGILLAALSLTVIYVVWAQSNGLWLLGGHDLQNTRYQNAENKISTANAHLLSPQWIFLTGGDVSATPAVDTSHVYVPDWAGNLFAIQRTTGTPVWSRTISSYTGITGDYARATPAVFGNTLILGDQAGKLLAGAYVMAIDARSGNRLWVTQVESHPAAIVTQSAVVTTVNFYPNPIVYVGVASNEELDADIPGYQCCSFRGSVLALDATNGKILWKQYMVPEGYSGGAVWGSTPVVDLARGSLYVGTGNNYSVPSDVRKCVDAAVGNPIAEQACISPDDHFDSAVALDLKDGSFKWTQMALPFDAWNMGCVAPVNLTACPPIAGPDYDFAQGPALFTVHMPGGASRDLLGIGQKSGKYWAFDPASGDLIWSTQVGPGGLDGGMEWGSATDSNRIYVAEANFNAVPWTLQGSGPSAGVTVFSGFWSALDAATGTILWQTPDPLAARDLGAVTTANGVVYACSLDPTGQMYAMNAATGQILWNFLSGGSCNAGAAVSQGTVYWGSGYTQLGTPNNKLYAFRTP